MKKPTFAILFALFLFGACTKKETVIKSSSTTGSDTITIPGGTSGTNGGLSSNEIQECGVKTENDEVDNTCYYVASPTVIAHGNPLVNNEFFYQTSVHTTEIPQTRFKSDLKYQVRIMPKVASYNDSTTGRSPMRTCNSPINASNGKYTYSKLAVTIELKHKALNFFAGTKTIYADLKQNTSNGLGWTPSSKVVFDTDGHPGEYDIRIKRIQTNHRCSYFGTKNNDCTTLEDLPYVTTQSTKTDCVAFEIHFATDDTRNLP